MTAFNEDTRVKIPALIHLTRLGYKYIPHSQQEQRDKTCNIFTSIFLESTKKLNPSATEGDLNKLLQDLIVKLENDDLGKAFYLAITGTQNTFKTIDFDDFTNNSLHCTTELTYKNGDDEFRPDITILINGLPLVFIEVKKPNNPNGIQAERTRMSDRCKNEKFKKFINLTQFMIYSNNMEYDDTNNLQGAFYTTCVQPKKNAHFTDDLNISFNYFREEEELKNILLDINDATENDILKDNNLATLKHAPEFSTNKNPDSPTNKILTSLLCKYRVCFILKYAIAYVAKDNNNIEKHIMRYPQIFATLAIANKLDAGIKKGVIWHTQGSGKTALAFYNVKYLTNFYQKKNIIAKFFFIVDRIDLLHQAKSEFLSRGLSVNTIDSKDEFIQSMGKVTSINNPAGELEITVINIQKFSKDSNVCKDIKYDINLQNIYFIDEVHRSYKPTGSFLANLINSDKYAILIGLTGTPLLQQVANGYSTTDVFGGYIHKYYYNQSTDDGYTLRLIREDIATSYKMQLQATLAKVKVLPGTVKLDKIYAHNSFIQPMLNYIVDDLTNFRKLHNDNVSAMVICSSSEQAKNLFKEFEKRYGEQIINPFADNAGNTKKDEKLKAILVLHNVHTKDIRNNQIKAYKSGFYHIAFVFKMLLTGFDAPILKKLYIAKKIDNHNLLQAITRVNRPYNNFKYGYIVDFIDIEKEFKKTNEAYWQEFTKEYGEEVRNNFNKLFKTEEEIHTDIKNINNINNILCKYNTQNKEIFSQQISALNIEDKDKLVEIIKALQLAKDLYNTILCNDEYKSLKDKLDFKTLNILHTEAQNRLNLINANEVLNDPNANLIDMALEDIIFQFKKFSEEELIIVDKLANKIRVTRENLVNNFDYQDTKYITLKEEFEIIFRNNDFRKLTQEDMDKIILQLKLIDNKAKELNSYNNLIKDKYNGDAKYARVHKRLQESDIKIDQNKLFTGLIKVKNIIDDKILCNTDILNNENFFKEEVKRIIFTELIDNNNLDLDYVNISNLLAEEYRNEYRGIE